MGYRNHALKGFSWVGLLRILTRGIIFLRIAVLARILSPSQFGAFGVATLVLSLIEVLTETGINVFLIQKKEESVKFLNSAWVVSIFRGIIIAIVLVFFAPLIANFFNSPESKNLIMLIALVPFIRGFINPSIVNIQKEIQFHKEFYLRITLFSLDAIIAIVTAFITKSAVSFVYGLIGSAILEVILSFILFKPHPKFIIETEKIKHIFHRSWWISATGIFSYFAENSDNVAVGRMLGIDQLGIYQSAYKLSTLPISEITETVNKVTFPVYSKFSEDRKRLWRAFLKVTSVSSLMALILGIIIFIFAEVIVKIVLGQNWLSAVPVVRVLVFYGILRTIFGNFSSLFLSRGKQNYVAATTFTRVAVLLIVIAPLITAFGMIGAGFAMAISIIAEIPIILFFTYRFFHKN